jgi:hypothetical protein
MRCVTSIKPHRLASLLAASALAAGVLACDATEPARATVDGLPILSVSEALAGAADGTLGSSSVAVGGWWSSIMARRSCAPPVGRVGELELYCSDGEYGITELNEPIERVLPDGSVAAGRGAWLTPYLDHTVRGAQELFRVPARLGNAAVPIAIVVVGHYLDARAADCRPQAADLCRQRLVVERIVQFGA